MLDAGDPKLLLRDSKQEKVRQFLSRAEAMPQIAEEKTL
jgi:hypothetical protein